MKNLWLGAVGLAAFCWMSVPVEAQNSCPGDCNHNNMVEINELVTCVNIALGTADLSTCTSCDVNGDSSVEINELVLAVNVALSMCPSGTPGTPGATPTATPSTAAGVCGDGHVDAGEDCDDGNNFGGDGCAANCTSETSLTGQFDPTKTMAV